MNDLLGSVWGQCKEGRLGKAKKSQVIILVVIFMLGIRLFFSIFLEGPSALAVIKQGKEMKNMNEADPLSRIGKSFLKDKCQNSSELCLLISGKEKILNPVGNYKGLVDGYPIEKMEAEISREDKKTADFLIAIAKKESNWGKNAPSKNGQDCYNYWGYKGKDEEQVLGYSCFSSREEAVEKVGARINHLIEKGIDTPEKMLVWKCGSTCAGHDPQGVRKWVADVESVLRSIRS